MATNISYEGQDGLEEVNMENPAHGITGFAGITAVIILAVNVPILWAIKEEKNFTFINILVGLDCMDSLAHIPILGVFYRYIDYKVIRPDLFVVFYFILTHYFFLILQGLLSSLCIICHLNHVFQQTPFIPDFLEGIEILIKILLSYMNFLLLKKLFYNNLKLKVNKCKEVLDESF